MPGKDGTPVTSTSELQSLVRLLHREHGRLYSQWDTCDLPAWCTELASNVTGRCSPYDDEATLPTICPGPSASAYLGSHFTIVGCFWSWWRTQPPPQLHPNIRPYCRARKHLSSGAQWVNVPKDVVEDLIVQGDIHISEVYKLIYK